MIKFLINATVANIVYYDNNVFFNVHTATLWKLNFVHSYVQIYFGPAKNFKFSQIGIILDSNSIYEIFMTYASNFQMGLSCSSFSEKSTGR